MRPCNNNDGKTGSGPYLLQTFLRIGTDEFTDSLALDSLTCFSPLLVNFMRDKKNAILELKSKSVVINNLKGLDHGG